MKSLREKRWDTIEILALPSLPSLSGTCYRGLAQCRIMVYIDGQRFGAHHIISAVGVDREEEMAEMFTLQRLKLPPSLYKCLATTNLVESPQSGVARRTANVKNLGHRDLWALATTLGRKTETKISQEKVA